MCRNILNTSSIFKPTKNNSISGARMYLYLVLNIITGKQIFNFVALSSTYKLIILAGTVPQP